MHKKVLTILANVLSFCAFILTTVATFTKAWMEGEMGLIQGYQGLYRACQTVVRLEHVTETNESGTFLNIVETPNGTICETNLQDHESTLALMIISIALFGCGWAVMFAIMCKKSLKKYFVWGGIFTLTGGFWALLAVAIYSSDTTIDDPNLHTGLSNMPEEPTLIDFSNFNFEELTVGDFNLAGIPGGDGREDAQENGDYPGIPGDGINYDPDPVDESLIVNQDQFQTFVNNSDWQLEYDNDTDTYIATHVGEAPNTYVGEVPDPGIIPPTRERVAIEYEFLYYSYSYYLAWVGGAFGIIGGILGSLVRTKK